MNDMPLGKTASSPKEYDPKVLFPIRRQRPKEPMYGFDIWRAYELSWLNLKGKPEAAIMEVIYPVESENIVESKSFKLYLNGLSNTVFESEGHVKETIREDLEHILIAEGIKVSLISPSEYESFKWQTKVEGTCIDKIEITVSSYTRDSSLLITEKNLTEETIYSDLLRTYCPVTHQPDWGSVIINYKGHAVNHASLLSYICSLRDHEGFSEDCCELIFTDIMRQCCPEKLYVGCYYTRRGGIDINPVRSSLKISPDEIKGMRLIRQ